MQGYSSNVIFIKQKFFLDNPNLIEMLDEGNPTKQAIRPYIFMRFFYRGNNFFIPLRTNMPDIIKYGRVGCSIPTVEKPNAGLDYRKMLIVNDLSYIVEPEQQVIPNSQKKQLENKSKQIKSEVIAYIDGFTKASKKGRLDKEPKYRFSTLKNFESQLK